MAENTNDSQVVETEEELTNYTTETNAGAGTGTSAIEPGYGTGRQRDSTQDGRRSGHAAYGILD